MPTPANLNKRRAIKTLDSMIRGVIRQRRASGSDQGDLLSMLLLAIDEQGDGRGMTDEQARDEAVTLFNAGHDTTAAALAWIWYVVARHPAVEARLVEEVDTALAGRVAGYADLPRLPYAEMVVKESLRLYPPTWTLLPREVIAPVELGGYRIERGSWVYSFPWVTHRDPRFFDDPLKFDPERFAPARSESIPPYAYFPFGGGPRVCIGNTFAMMEMILILASVLQQFRVKLAPGQGDVEPEPLIAVRPKGGLRVSLERRTNRRMSDSGHAEPANSKAADSSPPRPWRRRLLRIALLLVGLYLGVIVAMSVFENSLIFFPSVYPEGDWEPAGLTPEDAWFKADDGTELHGWYLPADNPRAVVLFAHGNGGNLSDRRDIIEALATRLGASVLAFDYRGYGRSKGQPTEEGVLADARAARRWLAERAGVPESQVVLMGESIGGAVMVDLAARRRRPGTGDREHVQLAARCRRLPLSLVAGEAGNAFAAGFGGQDSRVSRPTVAVSRRCRPHRAVQTGSAPVRGSQRAETAGRHSARRPQRSAYTNVL